MRVIMSAVIVAVSVTGIGAAPGVGDAVPLDVVSAQDSVLLRSVAGVEDPAPAVAAQVDVVIDPSGAQDPAPDPSAEAPPTPDATADAEAGPAAPEDPSADDPSAEDPSADDLQPVVPDVAEPLVVDVPTAGERVSTPVVEASGTQTVGVTWPEGADGEVLAPAVRTLVDGTWSEWTDLPVADDAPDAGSADAARAVRGGTDPVWVGDVDALQISFATDPAAIALDDVKVALVGDSPAGEQAAVPAPDAEDSSAPGPDGPTAAGVEIGGVLTASTGVPGGAGGLRAGAVTASLGGPVAAAAQPTVVSRSAWGARNQACAPDVASGLVGAVVHHTATTNSYSSVAAAMQQLRNIQAYHIDGRGWCDVGYNFLVDKWGNIYEGRANGMTQAVIGVHAGGFNTGTVGVSMLGDYTGGTPSAATQDAVGRIIGWRLGAYGLDPRGTMSYYTGEGDNSRFKNQWVTLPRVFGHRDTAFTTCPGNGGYATLGTVRDVASRTAATVRIPEHQAVVKKLYQDVFGRAPDAGGLSTWTGWLASGQSPGAVARNLVRSAEYAQTTVRLDYQGVLGRAPDPSGFRHWTQRIASGDVRTEDLRIHLLNSQEFYNISGGNDAAYVRALYDKVLKRKASQAEVDNWVRQIPVRGRGVVMSGIWQSRESAHVRIDAFYQRYLQRAADPSGKASWTPALLIEGEDRLRDHIVNSREYYQRAQSLYRG